VISRRTFFTGAVGAVGLTAAALRCLRGFDPAIPGSDGTIVTAAVWNKGKAIIVGQPVICGVVSRKPISNIPAGARVRLRMRAKDCVRAFVRTAHGTEEWIVLDKGNHWELGWKVGGNGKEAA